MDLGLHVVDFVGRFKFESDCLARKGLDEELHATAQTQDKDKGSFLLNIAVRKGTAVFFLDRPIKDHKPS